MKSALMIGRLITAVFWLAVVASLFPGLEAPLNKLPLAGALVLVIHVMEALFWQGRIRQYSDRPGYDSIMVIIFGAFHMKEMNDTAVKAILDAENAERFRS